MSCPSVRPSVRPSARPHKRPATPQSLRVPSAKSDARRPSFLPVPSFARPSSSLRLMGVVIQSAKELTRRRRRRRRRRSSDHLTDRDGPPR